MDTGSDKAASGRAASLVSLLQGIDRKHRHPQNPAHQACGVPEPADRQIERVPLTRLTACKTNARTHSPKQIAKSPPASNALVSSFRSWSTRKTRLLPATAGSKPRNSSGLLRCQCCWSAISPAEQRAFRIADNRLAELAGWDRGTLAIELAGLIELDFAVEVTGFDMGEIELILTDEEEDEDGQEKTGAGAKTAKSTCGPAVSRRGDVWLLGAHQLTCGDSPDHAAYAMPRSAAGRS